MTKRTLATGCLVLLLSITACKPGMKVAVADKAADEAAIHHVLDEIVRTFNAGDYDGMFAQYTDDVLISSPGQAEIVGKEAWRAGLSALPEGVTLKMAFDTKELEVSGDMAYERGTFTLEAQDPKSGEFAPVVQARHVHLFRRTADGWKGWRLIENSADPATALLQAPPPPPPKE